MIASLKSAQVAIIATQTNLLAWNAAIEAARAGKLPDEMAPNIKDDVGPSPGNHGAIRRAIVRGVADQCSDGPMRKASAMQAVRGKPHEVKAVLMVEDAPNETQFTRF